MTGLIFTQSYVSMKNQRAYEAHEEFLDDFVVDRQLIKSKNKSSMSMQSTKSKYSKG